MQSINRERYNATTSTATIAVQRLIKPLTKNSSSESLSIASTTTERVPRRVSPPFGP